MTGAARFAKASTELLRTVEKFRRYPSASAGGEVRFAMAEYQRAWIEARDEGTLPEEETGVEKA